MTMIEIRSWIQFFHTERQNGVRSLPNDEVTVCGRYIFLINVRARIV